MKTRVVVLGAGFGGLELASTCSEALGDDIEVTLIDKHDSFVFGYSKLDALAADKRHFGSSRRGALVRSLSSAAVAVSLGAVAAIATAPSIAGRMTAPSIAGGH